ncbi:hypothetical protein IscW_ISCW013007 [Ixodes scapularis]|uniref:Uncharacterized protein n=1 Tax=Ixodes scapularis TaxID=6945 RepID=B7QBP2_IXOSC|nr:hypothetical protein IscW_ISCW013007 [Ixodes scapularis]|eukprot:XP_002412956.1 hypothetical protein IscW_ISCW013007 [Ixodes scapularis]
MQGILREKGPYGQNGAVSRQAFPHRTSSLTVSYLRKDCSLVRSKRTRKPMASRKKAVVRLRNFSCPAVSHSCR